MHLYSKLLSSGSWKSLEANVYSSLQSTHSKPTGSPAQPVLLQDKLRLPTRTGLIWGVVHKLRVRIGDWRLSTRRTGRGGTPASLRRRDEKWRLLRKGVAPRRAGLRAAAAEGAGPGCRAAGPPLRPAEAGGSSANPLSGPQPRAPSPGALRLSRPLARLPAGLQRGAAPRATPRQALTRNTPPPPPPRPRPFVPPPTNHSPALMSPSNQRGHGQGRGLAARRRRLLGSRGFFSVRWWVSVRRGPDVGPLLPTLGT